MEQREFDAIPANFRKAVADSRFFDLAQKHRVEPSEEAMDAR